MSDQAFSIFLTTYSIVLTSILGYMVVLIKGHFNANKNAKTADMFLLRKALIDIHDEAMKEGKITQYSFTTFEDIWKIYHEGYKGNTLTDKFREDILKLPLV